MSATNSNIGNRNAEPITVTLVLSETGQSESLPVQATETTLHELTEWASALFGLETTTVERMVWHKDGSPLRATSSSSSKKDTSLWQAGIRHGDVIALMPPTANDRVSSRPASGGLDFSNLLLPAAAAPTTSPKAPEPVYYNGMSLDEARQYNQHPVALVTLLRTKDHLWKELHYYNPTLATEIRNTGNTIDEAANVYRQDMIKGGIENAMRDSNMLLERQTMQRRLDANPSDPQAFEFFAKENRQKLIDEQYRHVMDEYPESFGRVLMLYISATINGHAVQAFCDSGAQMTILSHKLAVKCGIADWIDTRFKGIASGVGTGVILGKIHLVQLQIGTSFFPCSVTVMADPPPGSDAKEMPFLLGLDMMKRHMCHLDLACGCLRFRIMGADGTTQSTTDTSSSYMDAPFLHEKDLLEEQGGTIGFDADKANRDLQKAQEGDVKKEDDGAMSS